MIVNHYTSAPHGLLQVHFALTAAPNIIALATPSDERMSKKYVA